MPSGRNVDERIVEMRIDNKNFEAGAERTISTLEKLERALHLKGDTGSLKDLSDQVSKFDASPMSNSLEKVQATFSALEIAGLRVIQNLTDSVYQFATKTIKDLTIEPVSQGWNKYEEKTASVQTIMNSTGKSIDEVNAYLDELMWFSDETSFSFTEMTSALGQMTSTGADIEKVIPMIMGIGNAVAYAGKSGNEFVRTIRNLNQSYSGGYLTLLDWRSLQAAGTNSEALTTIIIKTAEAMGKIKEGEVTLSNFTDSLKDKWADKEVMEQAFGYFAEMSVKAKELIDAGQFDNASEAYRYLAEQFDEVQSKAALAAQQAKSFGEVIDATKDAVSTGWMTTFEHIFGNYEVATEFWTDVVDSFLTLFAGGSETRNSIFEIAFGPVGSKGAENIEKAATGWEKLQKKVAASGHTMEQFNAAYRKVTSSANSAYYDTLIDRYGSIENAFKEGAISADIFKQILAELNGMAVETTDEVEASAEEMTSSLEDMRKVALEVIRGDHGNGQERIDWLKENGYDPEVIQAMADQLAGFHEMYGSYDMSDEMLIDWMERWYKYKNMEEKYGKSSFADYLGGRAVQDAVDNANEAVDLLEDADELLESIKNDIDAVYTAEDTLSGGEAFRGGLLNILNNLVSFKERFDSAFENVFGTVQERGERLRHLLNVFYRITEHMSFSDDALDGLQKIMETIMRVVKIFTTIGGGVVSVFSAVVMTVHDIIDDILSLIGRGEFSFGEALDLIQARIKALIPSMDSLINKFKGFLPSEEKFLKFIYGIKNITKGGFNSLKDWISSLTMEDIKANLPSMERLKTIYHDITGYIWKNYPTVAKWLSDLKETSILGTALTSLTTFFKDAGTWVTGLGISTETLNEYFSKFSEIITFIFDGLFGDPEELKQKIVNFFTTIFESVKTTLSGLTFTDFLQAIKTAGITVLLAEIAGAVKAFRNIEKEVQGIPENLSKMFGNIGDSFKSLSGTFKAATYMEIAFAIASLAVSMWLLSKIPEDDLTHVAAILVVLALAINKLTQNFAGSNKAIGSGNKIINVLPKFAATLIAFASIIGSIAMLFFAVRKMKPETIITTILGIAILIGAITVVVWRLSQIGTFDLKGVAVTMLSLGTVMNLLMVPLLLMAALPFNRLFQAIGGVIALLASVGGLLVVMSKLEQWGGKTSNLLTIAKSMALVSIAIDLMLPALFALALLPAKSFGKSFAGILGIIVLLGAIIAGFALLDSKVKSENIIKWAAALVLVALAFDIMIPAIGAFSVAFGALIALANGMKSFWKTMGKLAGLAVIMGAFAIICIGVAAASAVLGIGLLAAGVGIILFATGLALLSGPLNKLRDALPDFLEGLKKAGKIFKENKKNIALGVVAFVALAAALVLVIALITKLFKGVNIGAKIATFGKSVVGGVGTIMANIGNKIVEAFPHILDILGALLILIGLHLTEMMPKYVDMAVSAMISLFSSIADTFEERQSEIVDSVTRMVKSVLNVLSGVLDSIFSKEFITDLSTSGKILFTLANLKIGTDLLNIATPFAKLKTVLGGKDGSGGLISLIKTAGEKIPELIESAGGLGVLGPIAVALGLSYAYANKMIGEQHEMMREQATEGLAMETAADYEAAIAKAQEAVAKAQADYDNAALYYPEGLEAYNEVLLARETVLHNLEYEYEVLKMKTEEATEAGKEYADSALEHPEVTANVEEQKAAVQELEKTTEETEGYLERIKTAVSQFGLDFDGLNLGDKLSKLSEGQLGDLAGSLESLIGDFEGLGGFIPEGIGSGIASNEDAATGPLTDMVTALINTYTAQTETASPSELFARQAEFIPEGIGVGINRNSAAAIVPLRDLVENMSNSLINIHDYFVNSGVSIVQGLIDGIENNLIHAYNVGSNLGTTVLNGFNSRLSIHSPSRVFMEMAKYIPEGVAKGVSDNEDVAVTEIVGFGSLLIDAISKAMTQVGYMASDDFTISPKIVPVVDMSNVDYAAGSMDSMFGGRYRSYVTSMNGRMAGIESSRYTTAIAASSSDSELTNQVSVLSDRIDHLGEAITNMQIILDTGVIVGSTSAKMDKQLGRMAARKGRGN